MGYLKHVPGITSVTKKNQPRWANVVKKIHQWAYRWMKPGYVDDEMEYKISKFLLIQFICSAPVLIAAEGQTYIIVKILRFLRGYVFDKEHTYLYFLRKLIMTMFTAHSSAHEVITLILQHYVMFIFNNLFL